MLVKFCLSMIKCIKVGKHRYLMADLEEPCFSNRHLTYFLTLTLPQLFLNVIGLPLLAFLIIVRNQEHVDSLDFRIRFGLLYLGYRKGREWWEIVIATRKVMIVVIGTFGTMMGVVDLQAFLALLVVFVSLMVHLAGQPFDVTKPKEKLLHQLECIALTFCWITFWVR